MTRPSTRMLAGLLLLLLTTLLAACRGPEPEAPPPARPITAEEAQILATSRFLNYDARTRAFTTTVAVNQQQVGLEGWIDFVTHTGYARATGREFAPQLLRWNLGIAALQPATNAATGKPELPMPEHGWQTRQLDVARSTLDTVLLVIANLGLDRPENPLLLQQGGALWLREETLDGRVLTVYAAPANDKPASASTSPDDSGLRLWVDAAGMMHRVEVRTGAEWSTVDLEDAEDVQLPKLSTQPSGTR